MTMPRWALAPTCLLALSLAGLACEDRCVEPRRDTLELDEPGPYGASSRETFGFIEGTYTGTLWWSDLDEVDVVITTTLDASASAIEREHRGPGRLACPDALGTWVRVHIETPESSLFDDEVDVWIDHWSADPPETVESETNVTDHDFDGLQVEPNNRELTLRLIWREVGSLQGWLTLGNDDNFVRFEAVQ